MTTLHALYEKASAYVREHDRRQCPVPGCPAHLDSMSGPPSAGSEPGLYEIRAWCRCNFCGYFDMETYTRKGGDLSTKIDDAADDLPKPDAVIGE